MSVTRIISLIIVTVIIISKVGFLDFSESVCLSEFPLSCRAFLVSFDLKRRLNVCKLFFLLKLEHLRVDVLNGGLDVSHAGSRHGYGAS